MTKPQNKLSEITNSPQNAGSKENIEIPEQLRELHAWLIGDVMLDKVKHDPTLRDLHKTLTDDLRMVGRMITHLRDEGIFKNVAQAIGSEIISPVQGRDPVLAYYVAVHYDAVTLSIGKAAFDAYRKSPELYDVVFGAFIPADLSEHLALVRYYGNENATAAQDWSFYVEKLEERKDRDQSLLGLPTGLPTVDAALNGLRGLSFLAGDKGVGKTALALSMAIAALRADPELAVLFYSFDMRKAVIYDRIVCHWTGLTYRRFLANDGTDDEKATLSTALNELNSTILPRLKIVEETVEREGSAFNQYLMGNHCRALEEASDAERVLVLIDLFRHLPAPDGGTDLDADVHRVEVLTQFCRRTNFPVLAISEVRKGDSNRVELGLDDLFGSARLGYAADNVLLMWQARDAQPDAATVPVILRVAKGRDGTTRRDIRLLFHHTVSRFSEDVATTAAPKSATTAKAKKPSATAGKAKVD